mmetsp:Transcript_61821/g.69236  ORF Transcript_61821/g.69236 Transcript_61821/m.69236 type:complete len:201 (+) Transcript_61821:2531-3133(+)
MNHLCSCKCTKKKDLFYNKKNDLLHSFCVTMNNNLFYISNKDNDSLPLFHLSKKKQHRIPAFDIVIVYPGSALARENNYGHTTSNYIYKANIDCDGNCENDHRNNVNRTSPNVHVSHNLCVCFSILILKKNYLFHASKLNNNDNSSRVTKNIDSCQFRLKKKLYSKMKKDQLYNYHFLFDILGKKKNSFLDNDNNHCEII